MIVTSWRTLTLFEIRNDNLVCREAEHRQINRSACLNKMEETGSCRMVLRCRLTGGGIKPPKGALVKSHGTERLGNGYARSILGYGYKS